MRIALTTRQVLEGCVVAAVAALAALTASCTSPRAPADSDEPAIRWVDPSDTGPRGQAPGAKLRLIAAHADGSKSYVLVLSRGDEALTALADFARVQKVVDAHFVGIGAVRDPEVAWFDPGRNQYKGMSLHEQMEVLTLSGDIALGENAAPVVHAHLVLGRSDGRAWGGHLLRATTSPTLELYVTTYPQPLHKQKEPETGLQLIDPSLAP